MRVRDTRRTLHDVGGPTPIVPGPGRARLRRVVACQIGKSLFDEEGAKIVASIVAKAKERNVAIHLPVDYVTGSKFGEDAQVGAADDASGIPDDWLGLDVGPKSIATFREVILASKTILWNG